MREQVQSMSNKPTDLGYERLKKAVATPGTTIAEIQAAIILDMRDEDERGKAAQ